MPEPTRHPLPVVKVGGAPLTPDAVAALIDVRVHQSVHVPDRFRLRFHDRNFALVDKDLFPMGTPVDVLVDIGKGPVELMKGEVTQVSVELGVDGRAELVVCGLDRGHRLARGMKVRTFVKVNDGVVVRKIAGEYGLQAKVGPTKLKHEYLLQYGTDFAFLNERAQALGFEWWITGTTLNFQPKAEAGAGPMLRYGENLRSLRLRVSASEACAEVTVQSWDPVTQKAVFAKVPAKDGIATDAPFAKKLVDGAKTAAATKAKRFTGTMPVANAAEAKVRAEALVEQAAAEQVIAKGEAVGDPALMAAGKATIKDAGQRLSGTYLLTEVEHVLDEVHGYVSRFTAGGHDSGGLVSLLGGNGNGNGTGHAWVDTLLVGVVTNNDDPERLGRVKVRFPSLSAKDESAWARVVSVGAGKSRGLQIVPDVNDEVLVGFEHGDVRRPLVLGGLWSGKNAHPIRTGALKKGAVWRSHVGHQIEMSDGLTPMEKFVSVALGDKRTALRLGEDAVSLKTPKSMTMEAGMGVQWKVRGQLLIEADMITIKSRSGIAIEAASTLDAKAMGPVKVQGATAEVTGQGKTTVQAAGMTEIKGSVVKLN